MIHPSFLSRFIHSGVLASSLVNAKAEGPTDPNLAVQLCLNGRRSTSLLQQSFSAQLYFEPTSHLTEKRVINRRPTFK
jgi:hypothetical protein